jgi:hypothetical protein
MSAPQGSFACRITVDPSTADVLRVETKKVLMFNHEPFEDFLDYVPANVAIPLRGLTPQRLTRDGRHRTRGMRGFGVVGCQTPGRRATCWSCAPSPARPGQRRP